MRDWPGEWAGAFGAMARVGAAAVAQQLVVASGGNLSVRGGDGTFAVTGRGTFLDRLDPASFAVMDLDGRVVAVPPSAPQLVPSSEWKLHQRTYLARPDADAIVHLHPQHCVLLDALGRPLRRLTLDHIAYVGRTARIPFHPNGSDELAEAAAAAAGSPEDPCDCVILAFHGCSTLGATIEDAFRIAVNLESAATATYRMLLLGDQTTQFPSDLLPADRPAHAPPASSGGAPARD
jgi:L-fuculose-phosphate aldolase